MKRRVETKICGLTNGDDVKAALDAGADYVGFVLYERSPRGITAATLARLLDTVEEARGKAVAVFVNAPRADVLRVATDCGLRAVQIHGDEPAREFEDFPVPVWRAVHFRDVEAWPDPEDWPAERYVVDAMAPGRYGGTGMTADWTMARCLAAAYPAMLAGGLTPANVGRGLHVVRPLGVDVAGGVESSPGVKDYEKLRQFLRAVSEESIDEP